ncbi:MAG TPA: GYD domain-containing protein [Acidobacteriaceae bacterium]|nr:GYD domain-containing protein [Acidobacteriaceae bacterium]
MPSYLVQVSYTASGLAALIGNPQNRIEAVRKPIEKLGGTVGPFYMSFGDYDVVGTIEMPDNVSAAAIALAFGAGGTCKSVKTTPLLSFEEGIEAMKKAGTCGYKPAAGKK